MTQDWQTGKEKYKAKNGDLKRGQVRSKMTKRARAKNNTKNLDFTGRDGR